MADKKENSNKDDESRNNNPFNAMDLLLKWYNVAKDEERSLGLRKVQLSAYSLVGFTILIYFISLCFTNWNTIIKNADSNYNWSAIIILIIVLILMLILFFLIAFYISLINKYQRIFFMISKDLENKINEYIPGDNKKKTINTQNISNLSPMVRFVEEADLEKGHLFEKWYNHSVKYSKYGKK